MNNLPTIHKNQEMLRSKLGMDMQASAQNAGTEKPENTLVVIRHGSTSMNGESDDRIRGWIDVPLAEEGMKEVEDSVPALKKAKLYGLITSDMVRAKQTAEIISKEAGVPILGESAALRPWHLGHMAGQLTKEVLPLMHDYICKHPDTPVPGGESFNQFKERFLRYVQQIQTQYPHEKIGIVTHHRGERLIQGWMDEGKPDDPLKVKPDAFMHKGIKPGDFTDHEIPPPTSG